MTPENAFFGLVAHYRLEPDRKGEVWTDCPVCGAHGDRRTATGYSFSQRGYKCFVCGAHGGILDLYAMVMGGASPPIPRAKPQHMRVASTATRRPDWMDRGIELVHKFEEHPKVMELWDAYKVIPTKTLVEAHLGVGVLPSSRCPHQRLIVPIFGPDGSVVWFRGRSIGCDCGKWLSSGGGRVEDIPLYNSHRLWTGCDIVVAENPIDALLVESLVKGAVGVATLSVSYWNPKWLEAMREASPRSITVAFDNDLPGNGGGDHRAALVAEWQRKHPGARIPAASGPKLANLLRDAGLPAYLFDWSGSPARADIGSTFRIAA